MLRSNEMRQTNAPQMNLHNQVGDIKEVIDGGYCIGCGACTAVVPNAKIIFNDFGDLVACLPSDASAADLLAGSSVCPFSNGANETAIAQRLFNGQGVTFDLEIGSFLSVYAAYSHAMRTSGSSGGIATWLLKTLLDDGLIDYAIHVAPSSDRSDGRFFSYRTTEKSNDLVKGATSFYYPVSMDEVLKIIRTRPGRYAITGLPCFHKALRRLRDLDSLIDQRIKFQIGIVCGQMKSSHYLEYLTSLAGGEGELRTACFRRKVPGLRADDYAFEATLKKPDHKVSTVQVLNSQIGVNWGMGYFKPQACDFCDDVIAETADIAVMDAWLPKYVNDGLGWSLVVTRTKNIENLLLNGKKLGELVLETIDVVDVANSQRGGFNHRRKALPYRLGLKREKWRPIKRVDANLNLPFLLRIEQRLREHIRVRSRRMWLRTRQGKDIHAFQRSMKLAEIAHRLLNKIKRIL